MIPTRMNPLGWQPYGRKLSYLESTGTQYIDTGVKPDYANGDSVEIHFFCENYTGTQFCVFGSRELLDGDKVRNGVYLLRTSIYFGGSDTSSYRLDWDAQGEHIMSVDNTTVVDNGLTFSMPLRVSSAFSVFLFALNSSGQAFVINPHIRLYRWKYYKAGVLAQNLIPVLDKSGVPCMYDRCTRSLFYNAGSGTFNYA